MVGQWISFIGISYIIFTEKDAKILLLGSYNL